MSFKLSQLLETTQAIELEGDPDYSIETPATLREAGPQNISFFLNTKYLQDLKATRAGCVLIAHDLREESRLYQGHKIFAKQPQHAWAKILGLWDRANRDLPWGIDPAAHVSRSARLGKNVSIGALTIVEDRAVVSEGTIIHPHCYIGRDAVIGSGCQIYPGVVIREGVKIADRVIIHPGVVIGADGYGFASGQDGHYKIPQIGTVEIENDVEIGANTTIDRATLGVTRIGEGTKIDNLVQIAHNVIIGKRCLIVAQVGIAGSCVIGDDVIFGGQAAVKDHVEVASGTIVGGQAGVIGDVKTKDILWGTPARNHRDVLKTQALLARLPEIYDAVKKLTKGQKR
ncbi:MAG: UDP-3-O-(3-hydroxymyristoyl)glucosamine N-acyltransferase [Elusimicrobia bacterium]|nr:UDP-3-O-(3-hydroxymyristoyl)glucosamine N-acyltransferase [Elusimicrobiota bacterium]